MRNIKLGAIDMNWVDKYCTCGAYIGSIDIDTKNIKLDKDIKHLTEDYNVSVPSIVCVCNGCGKVNYIRGFLIRKR